MPTEDGTMIHNGMPSWCFDCMSSKKRKDELRSDDVELVPVEFVLFRSEMVDSQTKQTVAIVIVTPIPTDLHIFIVQMCMFG